MSGLTINQKPKSTSSDYLNNSRLKIDCVVEALQVLSEFSDILVDVVLNIIHALNFVILDGSETVLKTVYTNREKYDDGEDDLVHRVVL
jgi:hypothetical protein